MITIRAKRFLLLTSILFITLGILYQPNIYIFESWINLVIGSDILITDYFVTGSIGSALLNAGTVGLFSCFLIYKSKATMSGILLASVYLMIGFSLFGKNILNIWPIIIGSYLYSRYTKVTFSSILHISLFATSIAPFVSEILFMFPISIFIRVPLSILVGGSIGFLIIPVSKHLSVVHKGFNLYNIGFAVGILSTLYVSLLRSYGYYAQSHVIWSEDKNILLYFIFTLLFILMIIWGALKEKDKFLGIRKLLSSSGYLNNDYLQIYGFNVTLVNMGLNGLLSLLYLMIIDAPMNGPVLGAVLTVVGFGASGKHIRTIVPIFFGVFLGSITKTWSINNPSIIFAALFGTALAPIAGEYGFLWGTLASFINSSVVLNSGFLHAGLNLYNTGFSSGIVGAVMIPLLDSFFKKE